MDWNNDGKKDLLTGENAGYVRIYLNVGTDASPAFSSFSYVQVAGATFDCGSFSMPEVVDWNGDGEKDLLCGEDYGRVYLLINTGTDANPSFTSSSFVQDGTTDLNVGGNSSPVAVDWNRDGKKDLLVGEVYGAVYYFENKGTDADPTFNGSERLYAGGSLLDVGYYSRIDVADWDNDDLTDLIVGCSDGRVWYFHAMGEADLVYVGHTVDDSSGNGDGCVDPGETIMLNVELGNVGNGAATGLTGTLSATSPYATILDDSLTWSDIGAGEQGLSNEAAVFEVSRLLPYGGFFDDMEGGVSEWAAMGLWHLVDQGSPYPESHSPTHSWWYGQDESGDYDTGSANSGSLTSPYVTLRDVPYVLSFWSWEETEESTDYDRRTVEVEADGGWSEVYQSTDRSAEWHQVSIDLSAYSGKTIRVRFTFDTVDDSYNTYRGWYVDDVEILPAIPFAVAVHEEHGGLWELEFSVPVVPEPYLAVLSPNGGEIWHVEGTHEITWESNEGGTVDIELYKGGSHDRTIASGSPNDGSYDWAVPAGVATGSDYRVKITSASDFDYSDGYFTIAEPAYVTVLSPNGGETWYRRETYEVTWESNEAGTVDIDLYRGGSFDRAIASGTLNDGSYEWKVAGDVGIGTDYQVKVTSASAFDYSDDYFTVDEKAYVDILSPNGGETWYRREMYGITWESNEGGTVDIELYEGGSYDRTIASGTPNDGSYEWTIPEDVAIGSDYQVEITSALDFDYSDGYFSIGEKGYVVVLSPNGGEVWRVERMYEIRWESNEGGTVSVDLYKGDSFYRGIASATPNDGSYEWIVPADTAAGSDYRVKITSTSDDDYSDGYFTVEEEPRVIPESPAVWTGEWLHFTTTLGAGGEWSLVVASSGGTIDEGTGVYQVGPTGGVTDMVMVLVQGETLSTSITVTSGPRAPGVAGPATSMDVDGGSVGLSDVILMLKYVVGVETPTQEQSQAADFDCNGAVGLADVINALRVVVGLGPVL